MTPSTPTITEKPTSGNTGIGNNHFVVIAFNNDYNTFQEVEEIIIRATGKGRAAAECDAWEIHTYGKAVVYFHKSKEKCEEVAKIISSIGVKTLVEEE